jgi:hypothetical protein
MANYGFERLRLVTGECLFRRGKLVGVEGLAGAAAVDVVGKCLVVALHRFGRLIPLTQVPLDVVSVAGRA